MSAEKPEQNGSGWEEDSFVQEPRDPSQAHPSQTDLDRHEVAKLNLRLTGVENELAIIKKQQIGMHDDITDLGADIADLRKDMQSVHGLLERLLIETLKNQKKDESGQ